MTVAPTDHDRTIGRPADAQCGAPDLAEGRSDRDCNVGVSRFPVETLGQKICRSRYGEQRVTARRVQTIFRELVKLVKGDRRPSDATLEVDLDRDAERPS